MKKAFTRSLIKEIRSSLAQFFAIFGIVALGVGFFAGLHGTTPDMKLTADKYYDDQNLADFRFKSTMGFTEDDINALEALPYISEARAGYSVDALIEGADVEKTAVIIALSDEPDALTKPALTEGRYPENDGECLIDAAAVYGEGAFIKVGDTVKLADSNSADTLDLFNIKEFKIVGAAKSAQYVSFERGNTTLGDGRLNCFVLVEPQAFNSDYYLELYAAAAGSKKLNSYSDEYEELISDAVDKLNDFSNERERARFEQIKGDAQEELDGKKRELEDARAEYEDGLAEYQTKKQDADKEIADAQTQIDEGREELDNAYEKIEDSRAELAAAQRSYDSRSAEYQTQIQNARAQIDGGYAELATQKDAYNQAYAQYEQGRAQLEELRAQVAALEAAGQTEQAAALSEQAAQSEAVLSETEQQLAAAQQQIAAAEQTLAEQQQTLNEQAAQGQAQLNSALSEIDSGRAKINGAQEEADANARALEEKTSELEQAKRDADRELADAQKELDDAKAEIDDAQKEIDDAQKEIDEIEPPDWYVLPRSDNPGWSGFGSDADRIAAISGVFPFFFFLVAALVCLTTMTRMVEEQRTQIGLYKALGYSKGTITSRYILYALTAGILGSATGLIIGFNVFPTVIWHAYGILYDMPDIVLAFDTGAAAMSSAAATGCILIAAFASCYYELKTVPSQLMRQKAPPAGKRVFLERFPKIWNSLSFTRKVSVRNLFRYKKRFFMTVLGICGCTMLMLTGFGLRDSITHIVSKQYGEIMKYDAAITLADALTSHNEELDSVLSEDGADFLYLEQTSVTASSDGKSMDGYIIVPEDASKLNDFIDFKDRETDARVPFPSDGGAVITEKLANELNLSAGDEITVKRGDEVSVNVPLGAVSENYVFHYIYLTPDDYRRLFSEEPEYRQVYVNIDDMEEESAQNAFSAELLKNDAVAAATFSDKIAADFGDIMKSLDAVVWVLLFCANLLAFIVLYNLANINVTERTREIATIKVLGFYDREVSSYVFRENIILTAIGTALGLFFGIFLHRFVVVTAEVDVVMFERTILPLSFVYAGALTFAFAFGVNGIMHFRLKRINMVESLKSTE